MVNYRENFKNALSRRIGSGEFLIKWGQKREISYDELMDVLLVRTLGLESFALATNDWYSIGRSLSQLENGVPQPFLMARLHIKQYISEGHIDEYGIDFMTNQKRHVTGEWYSQRRDLQDHGYLPPTHPRR